MDFVADQKTEVKREEVPGGAGDYRESVRKLIEKEVQNAMDEELRKAAQELVDEQRKAIRQIVEKKAIRVRAEDLRKSMLKLGL